MSWAQDMDLKEKGRKEEMRLTQAPDKTIRSSWRPAQEDIQLHALPFIYCIFNSEL